MALIENFRANLRAAMRRAGITQAELAERAGLHFVSISRILNGKTVPSVDTCEVLARAVGMEESRVFSKPKKTA